MLTECRFNKMALIGKCWFLSALGVKILAVKDLSTPTPALNFRFANALSEIIWPNLIRKPQIVHLGPSPLA